MTIFSDVGRKIKTTRAVRKITQEDLAELIDMDVRSVIAIESGDRNPTLKTIYKICKALKVRSSELLGF
jgi:DNA-binding XRE family transcriptional regulator